jgi:acetyl esterase/lipase
MERFPYGDDPFQFGELRVPRTSGLHPAAIVIHGGFWRAKYDLGYIRPFCDALTEAGIATWNLEYRRIGNPGGGWPGTVEDVATGADFLASIAKRFSLDPKRVIAIGHSAGGHLALWLASRKTLLSGAISLAGVLDLRRAWELQLSHNVVTDFLGGDPDAVPDRYQLASPIELLPFGIPQRLFHGTIDVDVPVEISERYVHKAQIRGDDAELVRLEGSGHHELVHPGTEEFALVRAAAVELCLGNKM